jgi:hypothetical protein
LYIQRLKGLQQQAHGQGVATIIIKIIFESCAPLCITFESKIQGAVIVAFVDQLFPHFMKPFLTQYVVRY